jgi:hypothetical protein
VQAVGVAWPFLGALSIPRHDPSPANRVFDAYGPQRCYWGTDLTNSFDKATYRQRITHFTEELPFLSEEDKDSVFAVADNRSHHGLAWHGCRAARSRNSSSAEIHTRSRYTRCLVSETLRLSAFRSSGQFASRAAIAT